MLESNGNRASYLKLVLAFGSIGSLINRSAIRLLLLTEQNVRFLKAVYSLKWGKRLLITVALRKSKHG